MKHLQLSALLLVLSPAHSFAQGVTHNSLLAIARHAIAQETTDLNLALQGEGGVYREGHLEALRGLGKTRVDSAYLFEKCIYSSGQIAALMSEDLTLADDDSARRTTALQAVKGLYGPQIWKLISRACTQAEYRFHERLYELTSRGIPVALDDSSIDTLVSLVFYPTRAGRPSFRRSLFSVLGPVLAAAMFVGSGSALVGLPIGRVILSFALPANSLLNFRNQVVGGRSLPVHPMLELDLSVEERQHLEESGHP